MFIMEKPIKMDDLEVLLFQETSIWDFSDDLNRHHWDYTEDIAGDEGDRIRWYFLQCDLMGYVT